MCAGFPVLLCSALLFPLAVAEPTRVANTSFVALRFHKVASTTFKSVLASGLQPSYMEHETLAEYRAGGLDSLRCLGAPTARRVVFLALFREPASRILSALHFYSSFASLSMMGSFGRRMATAAQQLGQPSPARVRAAREWLLHTPCSNYTATDVRRVLDTFSHVPIGENIGAGMLTSE